MPTGSDESVSYSLSVDQFDKSLLPPHARVPGTDAFRAEVSKIIAADFAGFGGHARIVVDGQHIQVQYRHALNQPDPLEFVTNKLNGGKFADGVLLLRLFLSATPDHFGVLFNLGMALSDTGELAEAERHLRHALEVDPLHIDARVALGVAVIRQGRTEDAIGELQIAVKLAPNNSFAHRNLGGCLIKAGKPKEALVHLRRATELKPDDQQAWWGFAQALDATGDKPGADQACIKTIEIDPRSDIADMAKTQRTQYAHQSLRHGTGTAPRMDAVMYLLGAIKTFGKMSREQIQQVGTEVAVLGQRGLDMNDSAPKYKLHSLPGQYSGLHLVCLMYAAFKALDPKLDAGIDLTNEYETAKAMHRKA